MTLLGKKSSRNNFSKHKKQHLCPQTCGFRSAVSIYEIESPEPAQNVMPSVLVAGRNRNRLFSIICGIVLFRLCIVGRLFFRHVHGCRLVCFVVLGIDRANTICTAAACCFGSVFGIFFVFRFVTAGALVVIRAAALRQVVTIACGFQSLVVCLFQCVNSCSGSCGSCCNYLRTEKGTRQATGSRMQL